MCHDPHYTGYNAQQQTGHEGGDHILCLLERLLTGTVRNKRAHVKSESDIFESVLRKHAEENPVNQLMDRDQSHHPHYETNQVTRFVPLVKEIFSEVCDDEDGQKGSRYDQSI